eukprot:3053330-Pyramimonas_sp.AAC.1
MPDFQTQQLRVILNLQLVLLPILVLPSAEGLQRRKLRAGRSRAKKIRVFEFNITLKLDLIALEGQVIRLAVLIQKLNVCGDAWHQSESGRQL